MIRLLIGLLLSVGLALSPVAAEAAPMPDVAMSGCMMGGGMPDMPDMPSDHSKMDCCTLTCQAPVSAAALPEQASTLPTLLTVKAKLAWAPAKMLGSLSGSTLDPPPRL